MTSFIGIDPGLDGAIALIGEGVVQVARQPLMKVKKSNGKIIKRHDAMAMWQVVMGLVGQADGVIFAAIEDLSSRPRELLKAARTAGIGWGLWVMALAAYKVPVVVVRSQSVHQWLTKEKGIKEDYETKERSRAFVEKEWPEAEILGPRGGLLTGVCDAICIAQWNMERING